MKPVLVFILLLLLTSKPVSALEIDQVSYGKFGEVTIYQPQHAPVAVVLFVSGDGGWKDVVVNMAKNLADDGALVLGIDARHYEYYMSKMAAACLYPAADFEELSLSIQKKYKLPNYLKPVLMGYSYGATLIYGILVQAPANTFKGGIAIGFSPDIHINKPLCMGNGLNQKPIKKGVSYLLGRTNGLTAPLLVINGKKDLACPFPATETFLKGMPMTELVALPNAGHGFLNAEDWKAPLSDGFNRMLKSPGFTERKAAENKTASNQAAILPYKGDLPLTLIRSHQQNKLPMVFMISGDGGWTSFDQSLAEELALKGLSVLGLDAQKYFWKAKTPDQTTKELSLALEHYLSELGKESFILAGYSFGASIVPFVANRLPAHLKSQLKSVISLSPDVTADFEIHLVDLFNFSSSKDNYKVIPEMKNLLPLVPVSIFGTGEGAKIRGVFVKNGLKVLSIPGDHHFNKDYGKIAETFLKQVTD
ncbi:virulence factor [Pedobacter sp. N36a]|uniref:AcvB/VirJ family lysyl-phosphatidylglycerol hydrolase n=1 Tax=Pedobacter sp. N36a TaxID=2767996 RepID=UPI001656C5CF|nr:AcvB/VirJ family lysyl-phosphatidylglycerol hydrolase [Pedobacter sp. N36a]MBC8984385.1 virulence factor [Pedobacter sp. N36a]